MTQLILIYFDGFSVEIWGDVAAVSGVIVTAVTGILLFYTFLEQRKVTYLQQLKFVFDIKPVFEVYRDYDLEKLNFIVVLKNNIAYEFKAANRLKGYERLFNDFDKINLVIMNRPYNILWGDYLDVYRGMPMKIDLYFRDQIRNKYRQTICGDWPDIVLEPPVMVDEKNREIKFLPPKFK